MSVIMRFSSHPWPSRSSVFLLLYVGSMCLVHVPVTGTSLQSWQHLLKHPHYADDGHQHAQHVGSARSRNTRVEETQVQTTAFPHTSFTRGVVTTRSPSTTPSDDQYQSSVNWRTYSTSRSFIIGSVSGDWTTAKPGSSQEKDLPTSPTVTVAPPTVQNKLSASKGPSIIPTPAVHSRPSAVTFPPQDYYNVNESPEGFHKHSKTSELSPLPDKPKVLTSLAQEIENVRQANEHFLLMRGVGRCKQPKAQVIRVKDFYPDPSTEYLPRCTLLHRCNEQSGCCDTEGFQCMPKVMQEVALSFYVINIGKESSAPDLGESVTKLLFLNHTECECLPVDNLPRAIESPSKSQQNDHHHHHHHHEDPNPIENHPSKCQECPLPFCKREYPDGRCACDCFDRQRPCLRIKRGRETMQESERRCVETGKCHVPECEYGTFDPLLGRCPRKPEDHQRRNHHNQKNHHRWTFFERD